MERLAALAVHPPPTSVSWDFRAYGILCTFSQTETGERAAHCAKPFFPATTTTTTANRRKKRLTHFFAFHFILFCAGTRGKKMIIIILLLVRFVALPDGERWRLGGLRKNSWNGGWPHCRAKAEPGKIRFQPAPPPTTQKMLIHRRSLPPVEASLHRNGRLDKSELDINYWPWFRLFSFFMKTEIMVNRSTCQKVIRF